MLITGVINVIRGIYRLKRLDLGFDPENSYHFKPRIVFQVLQNHETPQMQHGLVLDGRIMAGILRFSESGLRV